MPRPLLVVVPLLLAAAAAAAGLRLGRATLTGWRDLRSARTYGLAAEQRPLLLRAAAAVLCLVCAAVLAAAVLPGRAPGTWGRSRHVAAEAAPGPSTAPGAAAGTGSAGPQPAAAAQPSAAAHAAPPAATAFTSIGHPAEGELMEASVPGPDGRPRAVRVWLPAQYRTDEQARFPVIVLHSGTPRKTADADLPDLFDGIASAVKLGRSKPFLVVAPEAPSGTEHPCELVTAAPQAVADDAALRTAVTTAFRTLSAGPDSWGALGVEAGAPCAAAAGLARPDLYGAAAAVSGRYDTAALAEAGAEAPADSTGRLLLAAAKADTAGVGAARTLQAALHGGKGPAARADVKVSDIVQDYTQERERLRLVRVAVQYLADTLDRTR
ncbi:hypothetical protein [Streptomyces sp. NRRL B-24484]|uniref:hypothetical protein n=1 Tax=Streptomyces sp. NRRL B-24484 TaxID=1463833 RepID=UPI0004C267EF|nr:hypothetical protein [Streptomyces sp. NRRL B-24484]